MREIDALDGIMGRAIYQAGVLFACGISTVEAELHKFRAVDESSEHYGITVVAADMPTSRVAAARARAAAVTPKKGEVPGMSRINRRTLIGLAVAGATMTFATSRVARGVQAGTASEVNWYNYGRAFYSQYLDRVLRIYEMEFENDRTNAKVALYGGDLGERKNYLKYYMRFDPNNLAVDQKWQNRANRRLEVYSKIKAIRDANVRDKPKFEFLISF